jgi:hypothetical protein
MTFRLERRIRKTDIVKEYARYEDGVFYGFFACGNHEGTVEVPYHMVKIVLVEIHFSVTAFSLNIDIEESRILFHVSVKKISQ